jgi:hypothetical protein
MIANSFIAAFLFLPMVIAQINIAQIIPQLPNCAVSRSVNCYAILKQDTSDYAQLNCVLSQLGSLTCDPTNAACLCTNSTLQLNLSKCVQINCTFVDQKS